MRALLLLLVLPCAGGCRAATDRCDDGLRNGGESDVDCGGPCVACGDGKACRDEYDCLSGRCQGRRCAAVPGCQDQRRDGQETDVDCGGPACPACAVGRRCLARGDCTSTYCIDGVCLASGTCTDGLKDGNETDVDCGGRCPACPTGAACGSDGDCLTAICQGGTCHAFPCSDGLLDGDESDVDCGGSCSPCAPGQRCGGDQDCSSDHCDAGVCAMQSALCSLGYTPDPRTKLCVCDPATCGSCCNVAEGNLCGPIDLPGHNNCGGRGQTCFACGLTEQCARGTGPDYSAPSCQQGLACGGCCGLGRMLRTYCFHGDADTNCGTAGAACLDCTLSRQRCVHHKCQ